MWKSFIQFFALDNRAADVQSKNGCPMVAKTVTGPEVCAQTVSQCCGRPRRNPMRTDPNETRDRFREWCKLTLIKKEINALLGDFGVQQVLELVHSCVSTHLSKYFISVSDVSLALFQSDRLVQEGKSVAKRQPFHR